MLRSFAYADAYFKGCRPNLAEYFLEAYWQEMGNSFLLPIKQKNRKALLFSYVLEKALYEISYELGNRPAWLLVPLQGFLEAYKDYYY
jgi:maltose alpha-D-glucosyltransferase/alpha-amylase